MIKSLKQVMAVFLFGFLLGTIINLNLNSEFNLDESSISVVKSLRAGGSFDNNLSSNQNPAFVLQQPGQGSRGSSGERSSNSKDIRPVDPKLPSRFGYRTALSSNKKLPNNPGGSGSSGNPGSTNNQDNELAWKNIRNDPEIWTKYQDYCQYQSKRKQQCDLIEIESKIKDDTGLVNYAEIAGKNQKVQRDINNIIEQLRLGNRNPGIGTKTLFKNVKESRSRDGARVYFREVNGKIEILAKSDKVIKNQNGVIKILKKKYG